MIKERNKTGGGESREINMTEVEHLMADKCLLWEKKIVRLYGIQAVAGIKKGIDSSSKGVQKDGSKNKASTSTSSVNSTNFNLNHDSDDETSQSFSSTTPNSNLTMLDTFLDIENQPVSQLCVFPFSYLLKFLHI